MSYLVVLLMFGYKIMFMGELCPSMPLNVGTESHFLDIFCSLRVFVFSNGQSLTINAGAGKCMFVKGKLT